MHLILERKYGLSFRLFVNSLFSAAEANTTTFWTTMASRETGIIKYASTAS